MHLSQHLKRQQNTLSGKSPHLKDPVPGSWPGLCWPADQIARLSFAAKNFPRWTKEMQESVSKQQRAGGKKKKKKSAGGETSPSSPQQANVS